ncbi:retrovirus-related pol polyprotein from transposon TNT 1-94, partial [Tanacetum coccineum]
VIQLVLWIVDSGCSKHMTGNMSLLRNFIEKFMGTICFRNDHFAAITEYGDYVQGNLMICHVYYVEGLGHNLFSVRQFCDANLEVAFRSNTCYVRNLEGDDLLTSRNLKAQILKIRTDNGTEFKNEKLRSFYAKLGIIHHMSIAQTPQQNGVVKRRNRTLVEAARTMLIFSKTLEFLRAEAIATACFTQNRFIVHTRYNKTPYELIRVRKPNVQYFHVFGSLYYPINNRDDLGKMKPKADIGIFIGYSESSRIEGILLQNNQLKIPQLMYPSNYNNNRNGMHGVEETVIDEDENAEEYAYHLEQATNFMENQLVYESRQEDIRRPVPRPLIFFGPQRNQNEPPRYLYNKDLFFLKNGNTKEKKYILSLHKIHVERFPEADLEEKMNHWVRKEFKNFNEDARLSIQHWKDSWHKRVYKQNQRRVKNNPEDYFSNHRITEVVRITTDQPHGLDFMEQIIVMRENDKLDSFSEADFKYLNKSDIEDLYYLYRNKKLGIKSYQVKVNLTAPTLTFPGIEAHEPYSIVDKPTTSLIYLNSKDEKRVMYLVEIVKFCDATLEKVLKEIKLKIFQSEPRKKPPLLGELDRDIMREFKREITKR